MAVQWYYKMAGKECGPFTSQELKQLAEEKRIAPTDPVRRDTDTEWSLAKNVKGLFPAQTALPVGVAVPVTPVKEPPIVVSAVKKAPRPPKVEEPEEESFDFGFDSSVSQGTKSHKTSTAKRLVSSKTASKPAARKKVEAEDDEATEKKPLTKKEIQKRNFMIIAGATGAVIVLAVLILIIASCKGSSKPKVSDDEAVATEEEELQADETAETSSDDEKADLKDAKSEEKDGEKVSDDEKADEDEKAAEESGIPPEFAEEGYKTPYVDGKWQSCTFGSAKVFIRKIKNAPLGVMNKKATKNKDREYCFIKIEVQNASEEELLLNVPGWGARGKGAKLMAGKNQYTMQKISVPDQADNTDQIDVGEKFTDVLVFNAPKLESIDALRLELQPLTSGDPMCKLYLPKEMFQKKASADDEDAKADAAEGDEEKAEADGEDADSKAEDSAEKDEKAENGKSEEAKPAEEKKAPSALDDESLGGEPVSEAPAASPAPASVPEASKKESDELGGASEENIDILNDPSLM